MNWSTVTDDAIWATALVFIALIVFGGRPRR